MPRKDDAPFDVVEQSLVKNITSALLRRRRTVPVRSQVEIHGSVVCITSWTMRVVREDRKAA